MKALLLLKPINIGFLPYNYNYMVSSLIHSYGDLHDLKGMKFTFYLDVNNCIKTKNYIRIDKEIVLIVSTTHEALINNIKGEYLTIGKIKFAIMRKEITDDNIVSQYNMFQTLSPIVVSKRGDKYEDYLSPQDEDYVENFKRITIRKGGGDVDIIIPEQPLASKLIDIKGIKIRGYMFTFLIKGDIKTISNNYTNGFGNKTSQGFGFVEKIA